MSQSKQMIILRKDLKMRKGKMIAQGAHASMKVFFDMMYWGGTKRVAHYILELRPGGAIWDWINGGFAKIAVSVDSEKELLSIYNQAKDAGLPVAIIRDSGRTEFHGVPTLTAVAIGPAWSDDIDPITKDLKLL
jgi:PTH2 family peptidyl-tRNA hydrolase